MSLEQAIRLERESIPLLLWRFSVPSTVATVVHGTYNVVDRIFVGQAIGKEALAALAVAMPVMMIMMAFGMMFGRGGSALISIYMGEKRYDMAERVLGLGFLLFLILAFVFTFFGLLYIDPLLRIFGAGDEIMPMAREYLSIILWGSLFHEISFGVNSYIRSEGNARIAMLTAFFAAGINVVLDPIFLFVFKMGVAGAAWATIIAQAASTAWVMWYYLGGKSLLKLHMTNFKFRSSLAGRIIFVGSPPFLMNMCGCVSLAILNNQLQKYGGVQALAIMSIIFTVMSIVYMPLIGIAQGAQPIFGYNLGAARYDRVRKTLKLTLAVASVLCLCVFIFVEAFPNVIFALFERGQGELVGDGLHACRYFVMLLPLVGTIFVATNYFQAINKPAESIVLSLVRQTVSVLSVLILPLFWGLNGIWMSEPVATLFGFFMSVTLLLVEQKKLNRKQLELELAGEAG